MTEVWLVEKWNSVHGVWANIAVFSTRNLAVDYCVEQGWHAGITGIIHFVVDGSVAVQDG